MCQARLPQVFDGRGGLPAVRRGPRGSWHSQKEAHLRESGVVEPQNPRLDRASSII